MSKFLDYATSGIAKYGKLLFILVLLWLGLKKVWFWVIMPLLCIVFLKQLSVFFGWTVFSSINPFYMIGSWVFLFCLLRGLFEKKA
jgi:hypothetical protein